MLVKWNSQKGFQVSRAASLACLGVDSTPGDGSDTLGVLLSPFVLSLLCLALE
jgi:hypothetical protein